MPPRRRVLSETRVLPTYQPLIDQQAVEERVAREVDKKREAAKTLQNNIAEAAYRTRGTETYQDASGNIQPVIDLDTGREKERDITSPTTYDANGDAVQMKRTNGQWSQERPDETAPLVPNPNDKNDKSLYKANKLRPWTQVDPDEALLSDDPNERGIAAGHLQKRAVQAKMDEMTPLEDEMKRLGSALSTNEKLRIESTTAPTEAEKAALETEKKRQTLAEQIAAKKAEASRIERLTHDDFIKEHQAATPPQTTAQVRQKASQRQLDRLGLLETEIAKERDELDALQAQLLEKSASGLSADEMPAHAAAVETLKMREQQWATKRLNLDKTAERIRANDAKAAAAAPEPDKEQAKALSADASSFNAAVHDFEAEKEQIQKDADTFRQESERRAAAAVTEVEKLQVGQWQRSQQAALQGRMTELAQKQATLADANRKLEETQVDDLVGALTELGKGTSKISPKDGVEWNAYGSAKKAGDTAKTIEGIGKEAKDLDAAAGTIKGTGVDTLVRSVFGRLGAGDVGPIHAMLTKAADHKRRAAIEQGKKAVDGATLGGVTKVDLANAAKDNPDLYNVLAELKALEDTDYMSPQQQVEKFYTDTTPRDEQARNNMDRLLKGEANPTGKPIPNSKGGVFPSGVTDIAERKKQLSEKVAAVAKKLTEDGKQMAEAEELIKEYVKFDNLLLGKREGEEKAAIDALHKRRKALPKNLAEYVKLQSDLRRPVGAVENVVGGPKLFMDDVPGAGMVISAVEMKKVFDISQKLEKGISLTGNEAQKLREFIVWERRPRTTGAKIAGGVANSVTVGLEIAGAAAIMAAGGAGATGATAVGGGSLAALAKKAGLEVAKWYATRGLAKKLAEKLSASLLSGMAKTATLREFSKRALVGTAKGTGQAFAVFSPKMLERTLHARLPGMDVEIDDTGKLHAFLTGQKGATWGEAARTGIVSTATEVVAERSGGWILDVFKKSGSALVKTMPKPWLEAAAKGATALGAARRAPGIKQALDVLAKGANSKVAKAMRFNGITGEFLEERITELGNMVLDPRGSAKDPGVLQNALKRNWSEVADQMLIEGATFAILGGIHGIPATVMGEVRERAVRKQNLPLLTSYNDELLRSREELPDSQILEEVAGLPMEADTSTKLGEIGARITQAQQTLAEAKNDAAKFTAHSELSLALKDWHGLVSELANNADVQARQRDIADVQNAPQENAVAADIRNASPTGAFGDAGQAGAELAGFDAQIDAAEINFAAAQTLESKAAAQRELRAAHQGRIAVLKRLAGKTAPSAEQQEASRAELAAAQNPQDAAVAAAALKLHTHGPAAMDAADLSALGMERDGSGSLTVLKSEAPARLTVTKAGETIFHQTFLDGVAQLFPATAGLLPTSELAQRALATRTQAAAAPAPAPAPAPTMVPTDATPQWDVTVDGQADPIRISAPNEAAAIQQVAAMGKGMVRDVESVATAHAEAEAEQPDEITVDRIRGAMAAGKAPTKEQSQMAERLAKAIGQWQELFSGVRFVQGSGSAGVQVAADGGLELDAEALRKTADQATADWADLAIQEEVIHRVAVELEKKGAWSAAKLFAELPAPVQDAVRKGYNARTKDAATEAYVLGHEFIRMLVQGRLNKGMLTELTAKPGVFEKVKAVLQKLLDYFQNLSKNLSNEGASPELVAQVESVAGRIQKAMEALQATFSEALAPSAGVPESTSGGTNATTSTEGATSASPKSGSSASDGDIAGKKPEVPENASPINDPARTALAEKLGIPEGAVGSSSRVAQNGQKLAVRFVAVEMADLKPSHNAQGEATPGYDQALQPRDRSLPEYRKQAQNIGQNLSFEQAAFFPETETPATTADLGSPVIDGKKQVVIGNGRSIGIDYAYRHGKAGAYKAAFAKNAAAFGIDPAAVQGMKQPVLVRVIAEDISQTDLIRFSQESNKGAAMANNAVETAAEDATRMNPELLAMLDPNYDLDSKQNEDFRTAFIQRVILGRSKDGTEGSNEANVTPAELAGRIRRAIFASAFGLDGAGRAALDRMAGDTDDAAKKITKGLLSVAGPYAWMRAQIAAGNLHPMDISTEIGEAAQTIAVALRDRGKVSARAVYAGMEDQQEMPGFSSDLKSAIQSLLLRERASAGRVAHAFSNYVEAVHGLGHPGQMDLFEAPPLPSPLELFARVTSEERLNADESAHALSSQALSAAQDPLYPHAEDGDFRSNWKIAAAGREVKLADGSIGTVTAVNDATYTVQLQDGTAAEFGKKTVWTKLTPEELECEPFFKARLREYAELKPVFDAKLNSVVTQLMGIPDGLDAYAITAPLKGAPRALEKAGAKLWDSRNKVATGRAFAALTPEDSVNALHDVLRGSVLVDSQKQVLKANGLILKTFAERFKLIATTEKGVGVYQTPDGALTIELDDRFANPTDAGYSDVQIKVEVAPGHFAELQVHIPEMLVAKEGNGVKEMGVPEKYWPENLPIPGFDVAAMPGHKLYEIARSPSTSRGEKNRLKSRMVALYRAAIAAHATRIEREAKAFSLEILRVQGSSPVKAGDLSGTLPLGPRANIFPSSTDTGSPSSSKKNSASASNSSGSNSGAFIRPEDTQIRPKSQAILGQTGITTANIFDYAGNVDVSHLREREAEWKNAFVQAPGYQLVPLDRLVSHKNELEDARFKAGLKPDPRQTAGKFIGMALDKAEGVKKRDPLDVTSNGDGTYTINDGNATAQALMLAGWKQVPVLVREAAKSEAKYVNFPAGFKGLGVPRKEMPQVPTDARGALVNFLNGKGIEVSNETVPARSLRPTQKEFSPEKVRKSKLHTTARKLLVSSEGYVLDGHHQWVAAGTGDIDIARLDVPVAAALEVLAEFPSTEGGSRASDSMPTATQMPDGAMLVGPKTITLQTQAFHGTPHKVDRFRLDKIGTGEGAQAYGWGLYFAEKRDVAASYQKLAKPFATFDGKPLKGSMGTPEAAVALDLETLDGDKSAVLTAFERDGMTKEAAWLKDNFDRIGFERPGNLYTVELLPDEADFLDWDKPLSEQSEKVRLALTQLPHYDSYLTGGYVYESLTRKHNVKNKTEDGAKQISANLASLGIPGIRYLDGNSRRPNEMERVATEEAAREYATKQEAKGWKVTRIASMGEGWGWAVHSEPPRTRNFVIFDENLVRILEENGQPVDETRATSLQSQLLEADRSLQKYFDFYEVPEKYRQEAARAKASQAIAVSARDRGPDYEAEKETALRALDQGPVSSLFQKLITREIPRFDVRGAVIETAADVHALMLALRSHFAESVKILVMDDRMQVIGSRIITVGSVNETVVGMREIHGAMESILSEHKGKVSGWILSHNHPSGETTPSQADIKFTRTANNVSAVLGVPLLDHVITNGTTHYSFRETGAFIPFHKKTIPVPHERYAEPKRVSGKKPDWQKAILTGQNAQWEVVSTTDRPAINSETEGLDFVGRLKTLDPDQMHAVYLDTQNKVIEVERIDVGTPGGEISQKARQELFRGVSRSGAYGVLLSVGANSNGIGQPSNFRNLQDSLREMNARLLDVYAMEASGQTTSLRGSGVLNEPAAGSLGTQQLDLFTDYVNTLPLHERTSTRAVAARAQKELPPPVAEDLFAWAQNSDTVQDERIPTRKSGPGNRRTDGTPDKKSGEAGTVWEMAGEDDLFGFAARSGAGNSGQSDGIGERDDGSGRGIRSDANDGQSDTGSAGESGVSGLVGDRRGRAPGTEGYNAADGLRGRGRELPGIVPTPENEADRNARIDPGQTLVPKAQGAKIAANFKVIELLRQLTAEGRNPTPEEKAQLLTYSGWGHSKPAFDDAKAKGYEKVSGGYYDTEWNRSKEDFKRRFNYRAIDKATGKEQASIYDYYAWNEAWGDVHRELHEKLTDKEYNAAKRSVLNAHYTTPAIIDAQWRMLEKLGFRGGKALEPGAGIGHYIGTQPQHLAERTTWSAVELDHVTAQILSLLYPQARVNSVSAAPGREVVGQGFEEALIADNSQDVVISNVPFHETGPWQAKKEFKQELNLHNYFFARALSKVKPGGLVVFITSSSTMENNADQRRFLASRGELISAVRLPNNAFMANAGTQVTTDIIILRKPDGRKVPNHAWAGSRVVGRDKVKLIRKNATPIQFLKSFDVEGTWVDPTLEAARKAWDALRVAGLELKDAEKKANTAATAKAWKAYVEAFEKAEGDSINSKLEAEVPIRVNEYFAANPQNAFGRHTLAGSMYKADEYALQEDLTGGTLEERFNRVIAELPEDIMGQTTDIKLATVRDVERTDKPFSFVERDGKFWQVQKSNLVPMEWSNAEQIIFRSWKKVKDAVRNLIAAELDPKTEAGELATLREALNNAYDKHVGYFGAISKTGVGQRHKHLSEDPDFPLTVALETPENFTNRKGKSETRYIKADIFRTRMNKPLTPPETAESASDALLSSLVWVGYPHVPYMASLLNRPEASVREEILESELVFADPVSGNLVIRDAYLSGFVQGKLDEARAAAEEDPAYRRNIAALEKALPERKGISQIGVAMNSPWLPPEVLTGFMENLGIKEPKAKYSVEANTWILDGYGGSDEFSTENVDTLELIEHALAMTVPRVSTYEGSGKERKLVFNPGATQLAKSKLEKLKAEFQRWAKMSDAEVGGVSVQEIIVDAFNQKANGIKPPSFKGEHITLPGASDEVFRSGIRRAAIARMLDQGGGMIAHGVGFGKTYTLIALAMEMKRLGKANRPMIIVENATLTQFAASFRVAYPNANLLVADEKSFEGKNRRQFVSRIATGDHDCILMAHSQFNLIGNHPDVVNSYIDDQVAELTAARALTDSSNKRAVAALEKAKINLENARKDILDSLAKRQDNGLNWEDLGIDALLVDEAHRYKNAPVITRMQGMKNLPTGKPSQRAVGMVIKTKGIQDRNAGRGIFFATGTPVSNSMAEAFVMLRYTSPNLLANQGIENFDQFVASFGVADTKAEANWKGAVAMETRLSKFVNGNSLINLIRSSWDVQMDPEVAGIKRPEIKGGAAKQVLIKPGEANRAYNSWVINTIARQWDDPQYWQSMGGKKKAFEENPALSAIPIMTMQAGIAAALDIRLIDPNAADYPGSKVNTAVRKIVENYKATASYSGTQCVFADLRESFSIDHLLAFAGDPGLSDKGLEVPVEPVVLDENGNPLPRPKKKKPDKEFDLYHDIANKLVEAGIPRREIGLIDSEMKAEKRAAIFDKVNSGEIRVIIGSTDLMGVGVNMQERLHSMHHLMPPRDFKPASQEQRTGRILRQGNLHYDMALEAFVASAEKSTGKTFRKDKGGKTVPDMRAATAALDADGLSKAEAAAEKFHIEEYQYAMEKSIDSAIYSMMASKQRMVVQLLMGEVTDTFEDPSDSISMGMAEIAARAIGDPLLIRRVELDRELRELSAEFQGFQDDLMTSRERLRSTQHELGQMSAKIAKAEKAIPIGRIGTDPDRETVWTFGGKTVDRNRPTDEEAAKGWKAPKLIEELDMFLLEESSNLAKSDRKIAKVGIEVDGVPFSIEIHQSIGDTRTVQQKYEDAMAGKDSSVSAKGDVFPVGYDDASTGFAGAQSLISKISNMAKAFAAAPARLEEYRKFLESQIPSLQEKASRTFDRADQLEALRKEMDQVKAQLAERAAPAPARPTDNDSNPPALQSQAFGGTKATLPDFQRAGLETARAMAEDGVLRSQSFDDLLKQNGVNLDVLDGYTEQAAREKSGQRTVGNPELGLGGGVNSPNDPVIFGLDAYRQATLEQESFEQWNEKARRLLEYDYEGTFDHIVRYGLEMGHGTLDPVFTRAAQLMVEAESRLPSTPDRVRRIQALVWAYRMSGTEQARGLASRRDPFKTPSERNREFLAKAILTPPPHVRKKMEKAMATAETPQKRAEITEKYLDADLKNRIGKIEKALGKMGLTMDDVLNGEVALGLVNSEMAKAVLGKHTGNAAKAAKLAQGAEKSAADIAKETGLSPAEVAAIAEANRKAFMDEAIRRLKLARETTKLSAQPIDPKGNVIDFSVGAGMSDAEIEAYAAQLAQQAGFFPADQLGKRKTVKRKKHKLFTPPSPTSSASKNPNWKPKEPPPGPWTSPKGIPPMLPWKVEPYPAKPGTRNDPMADSLGKLWVDPPADMPTGTRNDETADSLGKLWVDGPAEVSVRIGTDMADVEDVVRLMRLAQAADSSPLDMLKEFWINGILSGPKTHIANITGNFASGAWEFTFQRGFEALWNLALRDKDTASFGEMKYILKSLTPAAARATRLMAKAWRTESDWFAHDTLNQQAELFETGPKGEGYRTASIGGNTGRAVRIPGRALIAMDGFFKGMYGTMEAAAQAYRIAKGEGLKGEALQTRLNELVNTPGSQAWQLAVEKARELVFQQDLPEAVKIFQNMINVTKIGFFLFPFIRTPYNIFRTGVRKSPIGALNLAWHLGRHGLVKLGKKGIEPTPTPKMAQYLAEQTLAWLGMTLLWAAAGGDDDDDQKQFLITGSPPRKEGERMLEERATGGAFQIKLGDSTMNYGRIEPFATVLGNTMDTIKSAKNQPNARKVAGSLLDNIKGQVMQKTFLQGLSGLIEGIELPGKWDEKLRKSIISGLVPNIIRAPLRHADDTVRDPETTEWWYPAWPTAAQGGNAKVDPATAEDVKKGGNAITRQFIETAAPRSLVSTSDRVLLEYNRRNPNKTWAPTPPDAELTYTPERGNTPAVKVRLNKLAFHFLQQRSATLAKKALEGRTFTVDEEGLQAIQKVYEDARAAARRELRRRPVETLGEIIVDE